MSIEFPTTEENLNVEVEAVFQKFKSLEWVKQALDFIRAGLIKKYPDSAERFPEVLTYHGELHAEDVLHEAILFAITEGVRGDRELELLAIEIGAQDVFWHDNLLDIYTKPEDLEKIKKALEEKQIKIESASLDWVAKEEIEVSDKEKEVSQKLFEALGESDDVNDIYSNLKL